MIDITQEIINYEKTGLEIVINELNSQIENAREKIFLITTLDKILEIEELYKNNFFSGIGFIEVEAIVHRIGDMSHTGVNVYDNNKNLINLDCDEIKGSQFLESVQRLFSFLTLDLESFKKNTSIEINKSYLLKVDDGLVENLSNLFLSKELKSSLTYGLIQKQLQSSSEIKSSQKRKI